MSSIFISYRTDDEPYGAVLVHSVLGAWFGEPAAFRSSDDIPIGADYVTELTAALLACRVVLAVIGPRWSTATDRSGRRRLDNPTDWVRRELALAFDAGKRVVPLLLRGADLPTELELPPAIAQLSRCQYRRLEHRQFRTDIARLATDLVALLPDLTSENGNGQRLYQCQGHHYRGAGAPDWGGHAYALSTDTHSTRRPDARHPNGTDHLTAPHPSG